MLDKKIEIIKKDFHNSPDIVFRKIEVKNTKVLLVFNSTLTSSDNINDFILKKLTSFEDNVTRDNLYNHLKNEIPENILKDVSDRQDLYTKISSGFTVFLFSKDKPFAVETKRDLSRGVGQPLTEQTISGPKDAFTENYQTNIGLIRKRIKSNELVISEKTIGKQTLTRVSVIYMGNIAKDSLVDEINNKLDKIDIDGIFDVTYIRQCIEDKHSTFPTMATTERPDTASQYLLDGKVCVMIENSPYALVIPTFFSDLFHSSEDYYQSHFNVTFTRIIRYIAFFIAILIPAFYIAITTYNHETIPVTLLANFSAQRDGVPFPAIIEAIGLTLVFEILRESDIRMPHLSGTAISILGAIVLGDAAVAAGIVSPIMVIVVSLSAIASLMFSNVGMVNAIRFWRILFMLFATTGGMIGIFLAGILLITNICSLASFGKPYLYPLIPLNKHFFKEALFKNKIEKENKRMPILTDKNYTRSKL